VTVYKTLIALGQQGRAQTPDFVRLVRVQQTVGPVSSVIALAIIVLMVWKPGA